jgi:hypothetical protein
LCLKKKGGFNVKTRLSLIDVEQFYHQSGRVSSSSSSLANDLLLLMDGAHMAAQQLIEAHCETASGR